MNSKIKKYLFFLPYFHSYSETAEELSFAKVWDKKVPKQACALPLLISDGMEEGMKQPESPFLTAGSWTYQPGHPS
jgi:hypothetical protein